MEVNESTITAGGLVFLSLMGILLLTLRRQHAILPLFISGSYMTLGQILMIGPFHFSVFRLLLLFGWIRVVIRNEFSNFKKTSIDEMLLIWLFVSSSINVVLGGATSAAMTSNMGRIYDVLGIYFLCRVLITDVKDIIPTIKLLAIVIIPLSLFFILEMKTGRNFFSVFGSVPEFTMLREGRLRCQGPFRHPILAGTFGATIMPLFVGLRVQGGEYRFLASVAILASTIIMIASSSSGPLIAYIGGVVGLLLWTHKSKMKSIRWGIVLLFVAAHLLMKAPAWFLIARLGDLIGGGGWHRAALIDAAIRHFNEWWLIGTTNTAHWMATQLEVAPEMSDITNQFISEGVNGGLLAMILFIWLIVRCFKITGFGASNEDKLNTNQRFMIWAFGCTLFSHVLSFFSVTYFDQIIIFWYMVIAIIASVEQSLKVEKELISPVLITTLRR